MLGGMSSRKLMLHARAASRRAFGRLSRHVCPPSHAHRREAPARHEPVVDDASPEDAREHARDDAEAQGDGEAADRPGPELEQDQPRREGRHVRVADRVPGALVAGLDRRARRSCRARSSSRMRSRMRTFASTAMPTVSTMPAMPGQRQREAEGRERPPGSAARSRTSAPSAIAPPPGSRRA